MNEIELLKLIRKISLESFNYPFNGKAKINYRFKTTGGRYHLKDHHIEINAHFLKKEYRKDLIGIIKHELCHYYLHTHQMGYKHQNRDFKILLKQVGGSRYAPDIGLAKKIKYTYQCTNCHKLYYRIRRIDLKKYVCGKCHHKLILLK